MTFKFQYRKTVIAIAVIATFISIIRVILESSIQSRIVNIFPTFLILAGAVILIIGQFSHFENKNMPSTFTFVAYCVFLVIELGYVFSNLFGNLFSQIVASAFPWIRWNFWSSVNIVFALLTIISYILLVASLIMFSTEKHHKDSFRLLRLSSLLLLIFSTLYCLVFIVSPIIYLELNNISYDVTLFVIYFGVPQVLHLFITILIFLMTFFMDKDSTLRSNKPKVRSRPNVRMVGMSEKEKLETLKKYQGLVENGVITREEFEEKKKKLL